MNAIKNINPVIESAVRFALAAAVGAVGAKVSDSQLEAAVSVFAALVVCAISLAWSKYSDKKVVEQAVTK